ncbi:MAG: PKD domain-containing protein, partial [Desulfobacterales bacterium]|nr:PKD domain-containing protein [Desulfobacterales bacterium]
TGKDSAVAITLSGSDAAGDTLTFSHESPSHGTLSGSTPNLTYTPSTGYTGSDSFTFTVSDGQDTSVVATITITVNNGIPNNNVPVANNQSISTGKDSAVAITLSGSDADNGDTLTFSHESPSHGTLSGTTPNLTYTPTSGYTGSDSFTFTVSDGKDTSAAATITITVIDSNTTLTLTASRTSGVAPLGIFFETDLTSSTAFSNTDYSWNFGDSSSGIWAETGTSKNTDTGPVSAHVFETPGEYTVILTAKNNSGTIGTETVLITVENPETVYAGTNTVCISRSDSNDFTGCPDNAEQVTMDDFDDISSHISTGKRILLRRGDTWTTSGDRTYLNIDGPVTIGAYGDCDTPDDRGICSNAPLIHNTG